MVRADYFVKESFLKVEVPILRSSATTFCLVFFDPWPPGRFKTQWCPSFSVVWGANCMEWWVFRTLKVFVLAQRAFQWCDTETN